MLLQVLPRLLTNSNSSLVGREWKIKERLTAQFRAEFFNLFNRANFAIPIGCSYFTPDAAGGDGNSLYARLGWATPHTVRLEVTS